MTVVFAYAGLQKTMAVLSVSMSILTSANTSGAVLATVVGDIIFDVLGVYTLHCLEGVASSFGFVPPPPPTPPHPALGKRGSQE